MTGPMGRGRRRYGETQGRETRGSRSETKGPTVRTGRFRPPCEAVSLGSLRYLPDTHREHFVGATGLSANTTEYRARLQEQSDDQLDIWASELMRDVAKRRGVIKVVADFQKAVRRVFARGGGAPQTIGKDAEGHLMVPTISLHFLVPGLRAETADARDRLIAYLAAGFDELVYV